MGVVSVHSSPCRNATWTKFVRDVDGQLTLTHQWLVEHHPESVAATRVVDYCRSYRRRYAEMIALARAIPARTLLSVGISFGLPESILSRRFGTRVVGTDYRAEKTEIWASAAAAYGVEVVSFDAVKESAEKLRPYGPFDMIWCCEVLEHLRISPRLVVGELCRLVRDGGQILITVPNAGNLANIVRLLKGENYVAQLEEVSREEIAVGKSVFDRWVHVREPSLNEMVRLLEECTPDYVHWRVWLPRVPLTWRSSTVKGIVGQAAHRIPASPRGSESDGNGEPRVGRVAPRVG